MFETDSYLGIPRISIVIGYYNRRPLLEATLASINRSRFVGEVEICICDDGSDDENRLNIDGLRAITDKKLSIKLDSVSKEEKEWINPCIAYNRALDLAAGKIIILQNPECLHHGDIISYAAEHLEYNQWLSFACLAIDKESTMKVLHPEHHGKDKKLNGVWYNHRIHRPAGYHFCAAIHKDDIMKVGGFDVVYKDGLGYDDDDLLLRLKNNGINIICLDEHVPFVFHLYHENIYHTFKISPLVARNKKIFDERYKTAGKTNIQKKNTV
ncbi:MAG: glycosyltransferase [Spirochaetales bacterium]|nr:glycosyltransferase [Spirochaetales bacterium]